MYLSDLQRNSSDHSSGKRDSVKQRSRIQLALNAALFSSSQIEHRFAASRQDETILTMRASELGDSRLSRNLVLPYFVPAFR